MVCRGQVTLVSPMSPQADFAGTDCNPDYPRLGAMQPTLRACSFLPECVEAGRISLDRRDFGPLLRFQLPSRLAGVD